MAFAFVPMSAMFATVADGGLVWWRKQELQNGVEAAAIAVADRYVHGLGTCQPSSLALVVLDGDQVATVDCSATGSSTNGVVTVTGRAEVPLNFAQLIGRDSAGIETSASVRIGAVSSAGVVARWAGGKFPRCRPALMARSACEWSLYASA